MPTHSKFISAGMLGVSSLLSLDNTIMPNFRRELSQLYQGQPQHLFKLWNEKSLVTMATSKSHCICNEMQGILSKHSTASLCDLLLREWFLCGGTRAELWHSPDFTVSSAKVDRSNPNCYFCMGRFNQIYH